MNMVIWDKTNIGNESGMVLVVCIIMLLMLSLVGVASLMTSNSEMTLSGNIKDATTAFYLADAGAERAISILGDSTQWRAGFENQGLSGGSYNVVVADSTTNAILGSTIMITSFGHFKEAQKGIEVVMGPADMHPLFYHAIYAGNFDEYDPDVDSQAWTSQLALGGTGFSADIINGDIFFNGNVNVGGSAQVNGSIEAGGIASGNAPTEGATGGVEYEAPPDLAGMNYETLADFYVGAGSPWNSFGYLPSSDPRHIFVNDFRDDLGGASGFTFDNPNYFFGDPHETSDLTRISVSTAGNNRTYFIDGNLWIEPQGTVSQLVNSPTGGTHITIVVRGNIYFCDELRYSNPDLDGIAFIAMSDGESYTDENHNNQYDSGEPLLRDNGDGLYDGNAEGSGNVCFGDPNGGPLGNISGFIYAENNFQDHVLDGTGSTPLPFGVTGLLSAGNLFQVNRDYSGGHARMTINYDNRLETGLLNLPGLPRARGNGALVVFSWREL